MEFATGVKRTAKVMGAVTGLGRYHWVSAVGIYQSVFGELTSSTFGEFQVSDDPAEQDRTKLCTPC